MLRLSFGLLCSAKRSLTVGHSNYVKEELDPARLATIGRKGSERLAIFECLRCMGEIRGQKLSTSIEVIEAPSMGD